MRQPDGRGVYISQSGHGEQIMSDSKKTKKQLIDELTALRAKMDSAGSKGAAEAEGAADGQNIGQTSGLTRRDVLTAWVAPVILTVPLMPRMAAAASRPGNQLQGTIFPSQFPTQFPSQFPTQFPTQFPSQFPTQIPATLSPTNSPTGSPTLRPTPGLTPAPVPTSSPTSSPTAFPTVTPTAAIPVELSEFKIE